MLVTTQPAGGDRKLTRPTRAHSKMATEFFMFEGFFWIWITTSEIKRYACFAPDCPERTNV